MSSKRLDPSLIIERQQSSQLKYILLFIHSGAIVLLLPIIIKVSMLAALALVPIIYSLLSSWRKYVLLSDKASVIALVLTTENIWHILTRDGIKLTDCRLISATIHPLLIVLYFHYRHQHFSVPLFTDSTDLQTHRQLRVRLRLMNLNKVVLKH